MPIRLTLELASTGSIGCGLSETRDVNGFDGTNQLGVCAEEGACVLKRHVQLERRFVYKVLQKSKRVWIGNGLEERKLDASPLLSRGLLEFDQRPAQLIPVSRLADDAREFPDGHCIVLIVHGTFLMSVVSRFPSSKIVRPGRVRE